MNWNEIEKQFPINLPAQMEIHTPELTEVN